MNLSLKQLASLLHVRTEMIRCSLDVMQILKCKSSSFFHSGSEHKNLTVTRNFYCHLFHFKSHFSVFSGYYGVNMKRLIYTPVSTHFLKDVGRSHKTKAYGLYNGVRVPPAPSVVSQPRLNSFIQLNFWETTQSITVQVSLVHKEEQRGIKFLTAQVNFELLKKKYTNVINLQSLEAEVGQKIGTAHEGNKVVEQEVVQLLLDTLHTHAEVLQEAHDLSTVLQADLGKQE